MAYTTAKLLAGIARRSFAPTGQVTYSTTELLEMADEELKTLILPSIMKVREEFFVFRKDYAITASKSDYSIPARSIGMVIREVQIVNSAGSATDLRRIEPEQVLSYSEGSPNSFYLKNNQICLYPTPASTTDTLRVSFFLRPGELITVADSGVISAINTGTNTVTVTTIPSTFVTGDTFDFVKKDGAHEYIDIEYVSTLVSGTDIQFSALPSTLAVGDYICLTGYSPLVQLPPDYQPILAQAVAVQVLESMNQTGSEKAAQKLMALLKTAEELITPRVQGEDRVVLHNWF